MGLLGAEMSQAEKEVPRAGGSSSLITLGYPADSK